ALFGFPGRFDGPAAAAFGGADDLGDELDLGLDAGRQVGEGAVGSEDHEHVGEPGLRHAQVAGGALGPVLVDVPPAAPPQVHRAVVAVDRVEPGGQDQDVEPVLDPVGGAHAGR